MRIDVILPDETAEINVEALDQDRSLAEILRGLNLPLNTRCGERDMCAGCLIELVAGSLRHRDGSIVTAPGVPELRACRYRPFGDAVAIRVPQRSRLAYAPQVLDSYRVNVPYARDPLVKSGLGVAIDVGTTTVALQVLDLESGEIVGKASGFNRQMRFGDDVLTRINLCATDPAMLDRLRQSIVEDTIQPLLQESKARLEDIACFAVAGNTTMLHLLTGEDPSAMGIAPFTPRFLVHEPLDAGRIGLRPAAASVHLLPSIAAYVGADLTAGLYASGLLYDEGPSLLVDVGTNGEILLGCRGVISACATAAGPAFEGCGLSCGIRAGEGAISHVRIAGNPAAFAWDRIGPPGMKPTGICGSAYIDLLSEGRRGGLLGETGRFRPEKLPESQATVGTHGREIRIAYGQGKRPIVVTEADVARLLQAKAAIAAGILTLLAKRGLRPSDIRTLYLAGGFGMHLDLVNAIGCGLLPGFETGQVELVGNTSLAGATLALLDQSTLSELDRARRDVDIVELNLEPGFEDTYLDQLTL